MTSMMDPRQNHSGMTILGCARSISREAGFLLHQHLIKLLLLIRIQKRPDFPVRFLAKRLRLLALVGQKTADRIALFGRESHFLFDRRREPETAATAPTASRRRHVLS